MVLKAATVVLQPATVVLQPATVVLQPATVVLQPATVVLQPATVVLKPATVVLQPATVVLQPATVVLQPATVAEAEGLVQAEYRQSTRLQAAAAVGRLLRYQGHHGCRMHAVAGCGCRQGYHAACDRMCEQASLGYLC